MPAPPTIVSLPRPPSMTLASALPISVSSYSDPIRFSMPTRVSLPAATVFWATPCWFRSTVTPAAVVL